jgi:hypothetical protein
MAKYFALPEYVDDVFTWTSYGYTELESDRRQEIAKML